MTDKGSVYDYIITVCDAKAGRCPVFPADSKTKMLHWSFPDPSSFEGDYKEKLDRTRIVRDAIHDRIKDWMMELKGS